MVKKVVRKCTTVERRPKILISTAAKERVAPSDHRGVLVCLCKAKGFDIQHHETADALHHEVLANADGGTQVVLFIRAVAEQEI